MKKKIGLCLFGALLASSTLANRPIVFLHGWNSDGGIWSNMKSLLKANDYYADSELHAFSYYGGTFGYSKSTPIQTMAEGVAREITEIYYTSGRPVDLVTHSMGGLVVRAMLAYDLIDTKCIGRFISIAAPHYGQNVDTIGGYQVGQMKYGSPFLWNLADAWHFKNKKITETLCIAGIDQHVNNSQWDGLVHSWSASLDDAPIRYVDKSHSPAVTVSAKAKTTVGGILGFIFGGWIGTAIGAVVGYETTNESKVIYKCHDGVADDVYVLVENYLSWGWAYPQAYLKQSTVPESITGRGGIFFQILDAGNEPARYKSSDACLVHTYWHLDTSKRVIADYLEHGVDDNSSQHQGVELVFGTMPKGTYNLTAYASQTTPSFTAYGVPVQGGRMTVVRLRSSDGKVFNRLAEVRFNSMGGTPVNSRHGYVGDSVGTLPSTFHGGYLFAGWFTSPSGGLQITERSAITSGMTLYAHWNEIPVSVPEETSPSIPTEKDSYSFVAGVPFDGSEIVPDVAEGYSLRVSGLPSGLRYDSKTGRIIGKPTAKAGTYVVIFTATPSAALKKTGAKTETSKINISVEYPTLILETAAWRDKNAVGTVKGGGSLAANRKVTISAYPAKNSVFAGWWRPEGDDYAPCPNVDADYRTKSYRYTTTEQDATILALFATREEDAANLWVEVADDTTEADGTYFLDLGACVNSLSLPKLSVSGLPSGIRYKSKTMTISGKAAKPGVYTVTVKATNASVAKATADTTATFMLIVPNYGCEALPGLNPEIDAYGVIMRGAAFDSSLVDCTPIDGWTVSAAGLPAGLKWDAKSGTIIGTPTANAGAYTVTFTARKKGEKSQVATITLNVVDALPD